MGTSSGSNIHHQPSSKMLPPRQQPRAGGLQTSLSLVSSDPRLSPEEPRSNSDHRRESPTESASSRETWPAADAIMAKRWRMGKQKMIARNNQSFVVFPAPIRYLFETLQESELI
ncbi:unnamed protein product [Prunus armeniaca]|uniref:Uncharacterized protein n=1 Tax=Prunus armeniaca TaxID=36596 RepID=A0A6J5WX79_PRUAR|nr:unnamed protein product [Prunus armeniaca]